MNLLVALTQRHVPVFLKRKALAYLYEITAEAFVRPMPSIAGLSFNDLLESYAQFTETSVGNINNGNVDETRTKDRLRANAIALGRRLRRWFGVSSLPEAMAVAKLLYRLLGIDFVGTAQGEITIHRCFFAGRYSGRTCRIMSSFDEGILAGLCGNGSLSFSERLTEGDLCCKARFAFKGDRG